MQRDDWFIAHKLAERATFPLGVELYAYAARLHCIIFLIVFKARLLTTRSLKNRWRLDVYYFKSCRPTLTYTTNETQLDDWARGCIRYNMYVQGRGSQTYIASSTRSLVRVRLTRRQFVLFAHHPTVNAVLPFVPWHFVVHTYLVLIGMYSIRSGGDERRGKINERKGKQSKKRERKSKINRCVQV